MLQLCIKFKQFLKQKKRKTMVGGRENESKLMSTGELLEFMVGQFLWYS